MKQLIRFLLALLVSFGLPLLILFDIIDYAIDDGYPIYATKTWVKWMTFK